MPTVGIDLEQITDRASFHEVLARCLGFPDFYGRNMDAWIDCLTYGDDQMTAFKFGPTDPLTLKRLGYKPFRERCPDLYEDLMECAAFVNWRRVERGEGSVLALAYQ